MKTPEVPNMILIFSLLFLLTAATDIPSLLLVKSDPDLTFKNLQCTGGSYLTTNPTYQLSIDYVLDDLTNVTPVHPGYDYYTNSIYPTNVVYGHASCSEDLSAPDCATCMNVAGGSVASACNGRVGGFLRLGDCTVQYQNSPIAK